MSDPQDPLAHLRFALETMPGSRKYVFTPATRDDIVSALDISFWGQYGALKDTDTNPDLDPPVPGRACAHIFRKGETCFRCRDCASDDSVVLCARCFRATRHAGHNVSFFVAQQPGGCCDCCDPEAWAIPLHCPHHPEGNVDAASIATTLELLPLDLLASMRRTAAYAIDFILDTLDTSPEDTQLPQNSADLRLPQNEADLRLLPSSDPMRKDVFCLVLWNDDKHSFDETEKVLTEVLSKTEIPDVFDEQDRAEYISALVRRVDADGRGVIEISANAHRLLEQAHFMAQIDLGVTVRRAYDTFREQMSDVLIDWLRDLSRVRIDFRRLPGAEQRGLGRDPMMVRHIIFDAFMQRRNSMSFDVSKVNVAFGNENLGQARLDALFLLHTRLWKKPRLSLKEIYSAVIALSMGHKLAVAGHFAVVYPRIIDAYLLVDREAETSIKYFALQLFTTPSVAYHLARNDTTNNFNLVNRILTIISAFFQNHITDKHINPVEIFPGKPQPPLDPEAFPFKSKRFMPVFSDLRYLCQTPRLSPLVTSAEGEVPRMTVQYLIARDPQYLNAFVRTCLLFVGISPNKRAERAHVEYETDAWISVFNVTLSLARIVRVYGEAFGAGRARPSDLVRAIWTVLYTIIIQPSSGEPPLRGSGGPVVFEQVRFGDATYSIVSFDVLQGRVSFHNSLHWLLVELFKHVDLLSEEALASDSLGSLREVVLKYANESAVLTIIDYPLRVLAMIAQIRNGLWVRNGFAIRGQLLHYRDFMLRELCYDQDLFILQTALVILDPNTVLVSILRRFGLTTFFGAHDPFQRPPYSTLGHPTYDPSQLWGMVEELLYVLITLLSETSHATHMDIEQTVRREIIHALAVGTSRVYAGRTTYSELVKRVAERLSDDPCFERVLAKVSIFNAPKGEKDVGTYELREECFDEVNPWFYHYTRNKREEAQEVLAKRMESKRNGHTVLIPKTFSEQVTHGPFAILPAVFESDVLLQIVFYTVCNILEVSASPPPGMEAVLEQILHLIMLALVERPSIFSHLSAIKMFGTRARVFPDSDLDGDESMRTVFDVLCVMERQETFKAYKPRIAWILDQIEVNVGYGDLRVQLHALRTSGKAAEAEAHEDTEVLKKRAAQARKAAIMERMKAQQASFAVNMSFEDEEDMEDEEDGSDAEATTSFGTCIVCQEDLTILRTFGMLGLIQPSRFIRKTPEVTGGTYLNEVLQGPESLDRRTAASAGTAFPPGVQDTEENRNHEPSFGGFPAQCTRFGVHVSVCRHMMHLDCFQVYNQSIRARHRSQTTRNHPENTHRREFICPLCKSLGNIILPVVATPDVQPNPLSFPDWIRSAGIGILKSKPDSLLESLQNRNGTGEFCFWAAQDPDYVNTMRSVERWEGMDNAKMVDILVGITRSISMQSRHLRKGPEVEPGERGAGMYIPQDLVGYTIAVMEIAERGQGETYGSDEATKSQTRVVRGLLACLTKLSSVHFKGRPDEGRDAIRQAIVKRLLPEWSRTSLTSFSYPLLLRDPLTVLIETAAVAPEMLPHVLTLTYYACLARTVIGLVFMLSKSRHHGTSTAQLGRPRYRDLFGDVRMFFMSVVRHSPVFEHTATIVFETLGEARIERLLYAFTLPFLRHAVILCNAALPSLFATEAPVEDDACEYARLLAKLRLPPLSDLPNQDTLQNALSGWCAHYGHAHAAAQIDCLVSLDSPVVYRLAHLPTVLDTLFAAPERAMTCDRCGTVPADLAICMFCGIVCCMMGDCCRDRENGDRGECNMHTRECGGVVGLYFLLKRCSILYLYAGNGCFAYPPYLDIHGEMDPSMRRGRRQYLHHARWEEIRRVWLTHGIPTLITRKLEGNIDQGGWEML
ncbi:hypothetical protein FISHEDRAFT_34734 [Fistulina hepatica ATCC 64428]|uniref:E3 ubiquitin-protein ligase n=1 Tax=Fistulina hepatica ATCC 64428 TaxID=1128425 RepID=A0A0D7APF4_9AGAR|nr:hypothetical protein FISHEDRAFT_34734 [Fistulina hepatica ATCC 64428]